MIRSCAISLGVLTLTACSASPASSTQQLDASASVRPAAPSGSGAASVSAASAGASGQPSGAEPDAGRTAAGSGAVPSAGTGGATSPSASDAGAQVTAGPSASPTIPPVSQAGAPGSGATETDAAASGANETDAASSGLADAAPEGPGAGAAGVCEGATPHGCYVAAADNPMGCPPQIHEQSAYYPPMDEWVECSSPWYTACNYTKPEGGTANCMCDTGVHWLCTY